MIKDNCKVDMHVHSKYSHRPSSWILKKMGCAESYTDPVYLYNSLKRRGMDLVTITDHNTIKGCLEIAHLPGTFISEEVTTYFPEDNCKLHVLVYDITKEDHEEISDLRKNVFDLLKFLNSKNICHSIAHAMYSINGKLRFDHFEKILLLFKNFELNGARDNLQNTILKGIVKNLTKDKINELSTKYNIKPFGEKPWVKNLMSGSDDHSSLYMGYSYTSVKGVCEIKEFLNKIEKGDSKTTTQNSTPENLTHNLYSIMFQFYTSKFKVSKWLGDPLLSSFLKNTLLPYDHYLVNENESDFDYENSSNNNSFGSNDQNITTQILDAAKGVILFDEELCKWVSDPDESSIERGVYFLKFVNVISDLIMKFFADDFLKRLTKADLFYLFTAISSSASLYMMLSPYFVAYFLFSRDRSFAVECLKKLGTKEELEKTSSCNAAVFTDTFKEINGVATAIKSNIKAARITDKPMTLITCDPGENLEKNITAFSPIGEFELPEYPELKIYYPPILKLLKYCYKKQFTHIHAETPGAMGLSGLALSKLLNLTFHGTYHTSLPQTVGALTGDTQIEDLLWKYMLWFYGQMGKVFSPSAMTAKELVEKGISKEKIIVHPWGVDTKRFNPQKRNGFFKNNFHIGDGVIKLLYVGRVSKEKNLHIFEDVMENLLKERDDINLIIVGEGPYLQEMKVKMKGYPVTFTGYLEGEDLAQAYASSDIFVFPSTVDTMGNVVVEAQASGIPVIVTDKGGPGENMVTNETGLIVSADENFADNFSGAVLKLCKDPKLTDVMKKNARTYTDKRSFENSFLTFWDKFKDSSNENMADLGLKTQ